MSSTMSFMGFDEVCVRHCWRYLFLAEAKSSGGASGFACPACAAFGSNNPPRGAMAFCSSFSASGVFSFFFNASCCAACSAAILAFSSSAFEMADFEGSPSFQRRAVESSDTEHRRWPCAPAAEPKARPRTAPWWPCRTCVFWMSWMRVLRLPAVKLQIQMLLDFLTPSPKPSPMPLPTCSICTTFCVPGPIQSYIPPRPTSGTCISLAMYMTNISTHILGSRSLVYTCRSITSECVQVCATATATASADATTVCRATRDWDDVASLLLDVGYEKYDCNINVDIQSSCSDSSGNDSSSSSGSTCHQSWGGNSCETPLLSPRYFPKAPPLQPPFPPPTTRIINLQCNCTCTEPIA